MGTLFQNLFVLRGNLTRTQKVFWGIVGALFLLFIWSLVTSGDNPMVNKGILPAPLEVLSAFSEMLFDDNLIGNTCISLGYNLAGYVEAVLIAIPLGFLIGLFPVFRSAFQRPVDALRYLPIPAAIGIFIVLFGLGTGLKVHFLAAGILIYLIPVIIQRIDEVEDVYLKTVYTLGATNWQTIRTVYWPSVMSRVSDDIRVLTAISWTYIIVAETIGGQGGLGRMFMFLGQRQGRYDKVYALMVLIILIGLLQDFLYVQMDRALFPHKYQLQEQEEKGRANQAGFGRSVWNFVMSLLPWNIIGLYLFFLLTEFFPIMGAKNVLSNLFGDTVWVIHLLFWLVIGFKIYRMVKPVAGTATPKPKTA